MPDMALYLDTPLHLDMALHLERKHAQMAEP
jgi:hypothetical protein